MYNKDTIHFDPIVCSGNGFCTLGTPLIRDGRVEKFYWNTTHANRIVVVVMIISFV